MVEQIDKTNISVVDFISGLIDYLSGKTADKMVLKDVGGWGEKADMNWSGRKWAKCGQ